MARARNIKPAFFLNTELAEMCGFTRLAFIGMWTIADYKGCIECNIKKIKAQIMPYDDISMEGITTNLEKNGFIRFYSVQGKRYIKILNFEKHQNPHKNEREAGSDIPDITEKDNEIIEMQKDGTSTDFIGSARADSLNLIPSTLIHEEAPKSKPKDAPATRLPADWDLPIEYRDYCKTKRPDLNPDEVAEVFKNFWISKPGRDAKKLDWAATWRNWVIAQRPSTNNVKPLKGLGVITDAQFNTWLNGDENARDGQKAILGNG